MWVTIVDGFVKFNPAFIKNLDFRGEEYVWEPNERSLCKDITQKIMSEKEGTEGGLKVKSLAPSWSKEINNLIEALDQRKNAHDQDKGLAPPHKIRVVSKSPVKRQLKNVKLSLLKDFSESNDEVEANSEGNNSFPSIPGGNESDEE